MSTQNRSYRDGKHLFKATPEGEIYHVFTVAAVNDAGQPTELRCSGFFGKTPDFRSYQNAFDAAQEFGFEPLNAIGSKSDTIITLNVAHDCTLEAA